MSTQNVGLRVLSALRAALPRELSGLSGELRLPSPMLRQAGVPTAMRKLEASA